MFKKLFNFFSEPEELSWWLSLFYNAFPARNLNPTYRRIAENLDLKNEGMLVDVGTGPGYLPQLLAGTHPDLMIIGIDLSKTMIGIASEKAEGLPNLAFTVMNGKKMIFKDGRIDYVISTLTLHQVKKPVKLLNEIYRVLKPGGRCWIYDGYADASDEDIEKGLEYPIWQLKLPPNLVRKALAWHGYTGYGYESAVRGIIGKSKFKKDVSMKPEGIVMKIELRKE